MSFWINFVVAEVSYFFNLEKLLSDNILATILGNINLLLQKNYTRISSDLWWWTVFWHTRVKIIHLATPTPNKFQNQDSTREMNLEEHHANIRFSTWILIQDIWFFLIKNFFPCILYFSNDLRLIFDYFPLKIVNTKSPYPFQYLSS